MRHTRGRVVEVESLAELDGRLTAGARSMNGWRVTSVDLTDRGDAAARLRCRGCDVPGLPLRARGRGRRRGPRGDRLPGAPRRAGRRLPRCLYSPRELYDADAYPASLDARAYGWSQEHARPGRPARPDPPRPRDRRRARRLAGPQPAAPGGAHGRPRGGPRRAGVRRGGTTRPGASARPSSWPPVAGPGRWRRRTSAPTCPASGRGARRGRWPSWRECRRSDLR